MFPLQGHTPIDLAHQVHSPLLIHMLNHIKQERIRSNSRCLRIINRYRVHTRHTQNPHKKHLNFRCSSYLIPPGCCSPGVSALSPLHCLVWMCGCHCRYELRVLAAQRDPAGLCDQCDQRGRKVRSQVHSTPLLNFTGI